MRYGGMAVLATAAGLMAAFATDDICTAMFELPAAVFRDELISVSVHMTAMMVGLGLRWWWKRLTEAERSRHVETLKNSKVSLYFTAAFALAMATNFYWRHTVVNPYTGRATLSLYTDREMAEIDEWSTRYELAKFWLFGYAKDSTRHRQVAGIVHKVALANPGMAGATPWRVFVVDESDVNAFALPYGSMFFYRGLLDFTNNADQLSMCVAHEMAHCILRHSAEEMSHQRLYNVAELLPLTAAYFFASNNYQVYASEMLCKLAYDLVARLPRSRRIELEADTYGLVLAAAACVDHSQAVHFWAKMSKYESWLSRLFWWMATHPLSDVRIRNLEVHAAMADLIGKANGCVSRRKTS
ncbi:metalloendopeptidase OMA1, mitochondrial-like [Adelges cooleyi]|uniref:metalloendopeptidase OMA1, mitochondrial-like n=1 Tax=Adelges cooleyi TaxID=133065 RepID=UPI00217FCA27|nr:metalloendopeptidase OMA1, mitochondrial-like [Adelges cooleyi]